MFANSCYHPLSGGTKSQYTNSKSQTISNDRNSKSQTIVYELEEKHFAKYVKVFTKSITWIEDSNQVLDIDYWNLEFIWNLVLGTWDF